MFDLLKKLILLPNVIIRQIYNSSEIIILYYDNNIKYIHFYHYNIKTTLINFKLINKIKMSL